MAQTVASRTACGAVKAAGGANDGRLGGGGGGSPASAARSARSAHASARLLPDRRIGPDEPREVRDRRRRIRLEDHLGLRLRRPGRRTAAAPGVGSPVGNRTGTISVVAVRQDRTPPRAPPPPAAAPARRARRDRRREGAPTEPTGAKPGGPFGVSTSLDTGVPQFQAPELRNAETVRRGGRSRRDAPGRV